MSGARLQKQICRFARSLFERGLNRYGFGVKALFELAAPSMPPEVRALVIEGQKVNAPGQSQ